jgi:hypothetical protein
MSDFADPNRPGDPHRNQPISQDIHHQMLSARVPEDVGRGVFATATMVLQTQDVFVVDFLSATVHPQQLVARVVLTVSTFAELINALRINITMYEKAFGRALLGPFAPPTAGGAPAQPAPSTTVPATPGAESVAGMPTPAAGAGGGAAAGTGGGAGAVQPPAAAVPPSPPMAQPTPETPPQRADDLYDQLKLSDKMLGGVFANVAMIRHTPEDFCIDFMANLYPRAVVTARVFLAAGRILPFIDTLTGAYERFRQRMGQGPGPLPPA